MAGQPVRLKFLLHQRHWQTHRTFCREYDNVARAVDPRLVGTAPSRAQLYRWLSGDLKGLPYPDHCRILEQMFPGWTAEQLFEPSGPVTGVVLYDNAGHSPEERSYDEAGLLLDAISTGLEAPDAVREQWIRDLRELEANRLPSRLENVEGIDETAQKIARKLIALSKELRLSQLETRRLAALGGNLVELDLGLGITIAPDGWAKLVYRHTLFNMSSRPLTRIARELWFENTQARIEIMPLDLADRRVVVQRTNNTANLAKFACQISPPLQPGETATLAYACEGGRFVADHYWRQGLARYTRHFTLNVRHRGAGRLLACTAIEERVDGSETSATEGLVWDYDGDDVVITLTSDYLRPNQAITLRWDVTHDSA